MLYSENAADHQAVGIWSHRPQLPGGEEWALLPDPRDHERIVDSAPHSRVSLQGPGEGRRHSCGARTGWGLSAQRAAGSDLAVSPGRGPGRPGGQRPRTKSFPQRSRLTAGYGRGRVGDGTPRGARSLHTCSFCGTSAACARHSRAGFG